MPAVDLHFSVLGDTLPTDHGYALYSALAERLPALHGDGLSVAIGAIRGTYVGNGTLQLDGRSRLRLRLPAEQIPTVLPLAGQALVVSGHKVRLGVPQVRALIPAPSLVSRLVASYPE